MDEIISLIKKAQSGDKKAYEIILEKNKGLIWNIVNKFINRGTDKDDLFQLGSIGLIKCKIFNLCCPNDIWRNQKIFKRRWNNKSK